jgi:hypothetical protein
VEFLEMDHLLARKLSKPGEKSDSGFRVENSSCLVAKSQPTAFTRERHRLAREKRVESYCWQRVPNAKPGASNRLFPHRLAREQQLDVRPPGVLIPFAVTYLCKAHNAPAVRDCQGVASGELIGELRSCAHKQRERNPELARHGAYLLNVPAVRNADHHDAGTMEFLIERLQGPQLRPTLQAVRLKQVNDDYP